MSQWRSQGEWGLPIVKFSNKTNEIYTRYIHIQGYLMPKNTFAAVDPTGKSSASRVL